MGTRADFYIGRGKTAEWIGSIAFDGYPDGDRVAKLLKSKSDSSFRKHVAELGNGCDDLTTPDMGWPWIWNTSDTTDYAYAFDEGKVWISAGAWITVSQYKDLERRISAWDKAEEPIGRCPEWPKDPRPVFPVMNTDSAVIGGKRSGTILITPK